MTYHRKIYDGKFKQPSHDSILENRKIKDYKINSKAFLGLDFGPSSRIRLYVASPFISHPETRPLGPVARGPNPAPGVAPGIIAHGHMV